MSAEAVIIGDGIVLKRPVGISRAWIITDGNECSIVTSNNQPLHRYFDELYASLAEE